MREIVPSLEFDTMRVEGDKYVDKGDMCSANRSLQNPRWHYQYIQGGRFKV